MLYKYLKMGAWILALLIILLWSTERHFARLYTSPNPPPPTPSPSVTTSQALRDQEEAIRAELRQTSKSLAGASNDIDQALRLIDDWNHVYKPMRHDEKGKIIQQQETLANRMVELMEAERPTLAELQDTRARIQQLRDEVDRRSIAATPERVSPVDSKEIHELQQWASDSLQTWQAAVNEAASILTRAERSRPAEEPVAPLDDTFVERALEEGERQRKLAEDKKHLEDEALSQEVRIALAPFLERRNLQPKRYQSSVRFDVLPDLQPMSLSRLTSMGALDNSRRGLEMLSRIVSRPEIASPNRWDHPNEYLHWDASTILRVTTAQEMLRKYGKILVEHDLLAD